MGGKRSQSKELGTNGDNQQVAVLQQIAALDRMTVAQLRKRWEDLFGTDSGRLGRQYLIRRLAYRIQELVYGGLSRTARKQLADMGKRVSSGAPAKPEKRQRTSLQPGTRLLRDWHGDRYEVIVQEDGFVLAGKKYKSLTAVARAITGVHWNGNRFFGLTPLSKKREKSA